MRFRIVWSALAVVGGAGCVQPTLQPRQQAEPAPLDWSPRLDQPIRQLREVLAVTEQQQPMNYTSANLGFALDAKLYFLFQRYTERLEAPARAREIEAQRAWLADRQRAFQAAYQEYEGGTLASYAGNTKFIELTEARIVEIERRLQQLESPKNAGAPSPR